MSTSNPVFSATAIIAAAICVIVMAIVGGIGKFVGWCRLVDSEVDNIFDFWR